MSGYFSHSLSSAFHVDICRPFTEVGSLNAALMLVADTALCSSPLKNSGSLNHDRFDAYGGGGYKRMGN